MPVPPRAFRITNQSFIELLTLLLFLAIKLYKRLARPVEIAGESPFRCRACESLKIDMDSDLKG